MKILYSVLIIFIFLNCVHSKNQNLSKATGEDFSTFFKSFKEDSLFQRSRIDHLVLFEENNTTQTDSFRLIISKKQVNYRISFDPKDWNVKIFTVNKKIASDTTVVELRADGTGLFMDYYFAKRDHKWFLFKIYDTSD